MKQIRGYEVEDRVFSRRTPRHGNITMTDALRIGRVLCARWDLPPIQIRVARGFPHAGSMYYFAHKGEPSHIRLGRPLDWMVCHEMAHYASDAVKPTERGHGRVWAGWYVDAVRLIIPGAYGDRLESGFRRVGLDPKLPEVGAF